MEAIISFVENHPEYLLWSIGLIALVESLAVVGIIVPGVGILASLSVLAANADTNVYAMLGVAIIGAIIGDGLSFLFGRLFQDRLNHIWPFTRHPEWISTGHHFFEKHGGKSIFIGRFVGPVRPFIPMVAGMLRMDGKHFLTLNVASAICWAPAYLLPGYFFGQYVSITELLSWKGLLALTIATIIAMVVTWWWKRGKKASV